MFVLYIPRNNNVIKTTTTRLLTYIDCLFLEEIVLCCCLVTNRVPVFATSWTAASQASCCCCCCCKVASGMSDSVRPHRWQPPGSPVPGILQSRTLEWVAISFSNAWKWKVKVKSLSHVWLLATPWTTAHQAPLSMGFSRQEYCSGVPLHFTRNVINPIYISTCFITI